MAAISDQALTDVLIKAGFSNPQAINIAMAIVRAESTNNPRAHNTVPPDNSYGLFQINMLGRLGPARRAQFGLNTNDQLFDPVTNAKAAYAISSGGTNWRPWSTFTSGAYRQYLRPSGSGSALPGQIIDGGVGAFAGGLAGEVGGAVADRVAGAFGAAVEPFLTGLRRISVIAIAVTAGAALVLAGAWRGVKAAET